jgi:hypothetical protein
LIAPLDTGTTRRIGNVQISTGVPRIAWVRSASGEDGLLIPLNAGDTTNLHRLSMDGTLSVITAGTGVVNWPAVSAAGDLIFTRLDQTPSVWRSALVGDSRAVVVASPARLFAVDPDGRKLVYGRMQGAEQGQLVLRDSESRSETILASHRVQLEGGGSFWPQLSPDGRSVVYRVQEQLGSPSTYLVSTEGGPTRLLRMAQQSFWTPSDWSPDGAAVIGECSPVGALCRLRPEADRVEEFLRDREGAELLYPSLSWDGKWLAFMRRHSGNTAIVAAPRGSDGGFGEVEQWVRISPPDVDGSRPRFAPDGASLFYVLSRGNIATVVRQPLHPATKQPLGSPLTIAPVQVAPTPVIFSGLQNLIGVTRTHVYFNAADTRSNVWMMPLPRD